MEPRAATQSEGRRVMTRMSSLVGLAAWPHNHDLSQFSCGIVEAPWGVEFYDLGVAENREKALTYPKGLAFGETSELRWLQRENGLHLVYIDDGGGDLGPQSKPVELAAGNERRSRIILWGARQTDGTYYEGRIPRILSFPDWAPQPKVGGRLAVETKAYDLREGDQIVPLYRCVRLVKVED